MEQFADKAAYNVWLSNKESLLASFSIRLFADEIELDYSFESIDKIANWIIQNCSNWETTPCSQIILEAATYFGDLFIAEYGGNWFFEEDEDMAYYHYAGIENYKHARTTIPHFPLSWLTVSISRQDTELIRGRMTFQLKL